MQISIEDIAKDLKEKLTAQQLSALAYELEIDAKDKYYQEHPEEIYVHN